MADTTRNLGLPLIAAAQAQKHVTHNEALTALDALVQLACLDKDLSAPPANPAEGDRYLVTAGNPGGAWAGLSGQMVRFADGVWAGAVPRPGWLAYLVDEADLYVFTGSAWTSFRASLTVLQNLARLGIGTAADATNRLALKSNAALFSWDDATPGTGDFRLALNKQATSRDAAVTVQTNFSTRALFGLLGDDNFSLKVSPDGASFTPVLTASASTGWLTLSRINGPLDVSRNAGGLPAAPTSTVFRVSGADGTQARLVFDSFGSQGNFIFRTAGGTAAAPAALAAGATMGTVAVMGYGATAYTTNSRASLNFGAAEAWTDTAQGTRGYVNTTAQGAVSSRAIVGFEANGSLSLTPMSADPAAGLASGQIYANSTVTALKWYNGTAWSRLNNFAKAAASTNFDNYVAADTWTKVQFNAADGNDQGAFSAANNRFTAPEPGLYTVRTALAYKRNGTSAPAAFEVQFYRNGAPAGRGRASAAGTLVDGVTALSLSSVLKLAAGDAVEVFARFTGADGMIAAGDSVFGVNQMG